MICKMKKIILTERVPIKLWLDDIEPEAEKQAINLANIPFVFRHVAIMPDCHEGYGMPIGGVLATKGAIIPNAVGVDIGCGMSAVRTSLDGIKADDLRRIMGQVRELIPAGFKHQKKIQEEALMPEMHHIEKLKIIREEYRSARYQLGTLGGGNHFIEIQKGSDGFIWIMVHSGSRNLGKTVADYYNKKAERLNELLSSPVEKSKKLAYLPLETEEAADYIAEMTYCQHFAAANRSLMVRNIIECFIKTTGKSVRFDEPIDIAHNYARTENHFGSDVIIHRKGATSAKNGEIGIIPGSQGSVSYIVCGLGNPESFMSCSHGAGRKMSRHKAQKSFNLREVIESLDRQGIIHGIRNIKDLDEAPGAYKDIDEVMRNQTDLVKILVKLRPLAVIKG
jgi:tRNA-splicing ligase RtcB